MLTFWSWFILALSAAYANTARIGLFIPASGGKVPEIITDINAIHQEMYSSSVKTKQKQYLKLKGQLESTVDAYISNNKCIRYYPSQHIPFEDLNANSNEHNSVMMAFNINFDNKPDYNIQKLGLNIMDPSANTLRRISKIHDSTIKLIVDYPLIENSEEYFLNQYIDICFENLKLDHSWKSQPRVIEASLEIYFGLTAIKEKYYKSSEIIDSLQNSITAINDDLDILLQQLSDHLKSNETKFRDINEDTLSKYTILGTIVSLFYLLSTCGQIYWLVRYLKINSLA
ncbi:hypothetical protein DAMA08_003300 [Martiniozyma asiatica (nom. inval.)]|nr:hypothetical protein DAMA08_003300 [Martiniozyma asiatica]